MKALKFLIIFLLFAEMIYAQNIDDVIIAKRIKINSVVLGEEETMFVSTPNSYSASSKSYPVLYLLDGSEVTIGCAAGLINSLSDYEIVPEMIIVAISSNNRKRDFTPTNPSYLPDFIRKMHPGEADKFLSFIETELFPYMKKNYRTLPYRIFAGHSEAGLCVTHAFLSHTNMFDSYIANSPSLGWDSSYVNKVAEKKISTMNLKRKQIFISVGGKEHPMTIADAHTFVHTLRVKAPVELKWKFNYNENEDHYSQANIALYTGIRYIYDGWNLDYEEMAVRGLDAIKSFFQNQTEKYGYDILPDGNALNIIGMGATRFGKQEEALKIYTYNTLIHPKFPEAFSCLGSYYSETGNNELAIKNFEKAIELATASNDENLERYKSQLEEVRSTKK
jgi:predicted alpha/beta superfamily hydrolase